MKSEPRTTPAPALQILLIENDPAIAALTILAFEEAGLHDGVVSVHNGEDAMLYLRNAEQQQAGTVRPNMIFLDLHLPKISGLQVLEEIKRNAHWRATPVVVVSGSADPAQIREAYELHASCYVRKPDDLDQFLRFAQACFQFWGQLVTLPAPADLRS
ncbi:MAG TPA: response regulator [Bryobacteraceae bacterium]|jgi:CheY-like chemotaxis protein